MPDVAVNRQARHRYNLLDKWEAGLVLTGTEVKSLREGKAVLKDGYATLDNGEVWLHNVHIPPYAPATRENHEPERSRKLLLHRREIERLIGKTKERGLTLIPTRLYFKGPHAKVEIALRLEISPKTVEAHVSSVLRKLQLSSRHELSRWAADRGL